MNALRRRLKPSPGKSEKSGDPQTSQTTLPQAAPSALSSTPAAVLPPPPKAPELPKTTERPKTTDRKFRTKTHRGTLAPQFDETFVEEGVLGSFLSGPLQAKVLDHDAISFDDSLGTLELSLEALRGQDELELSQCKLSGVPHGTLSMVVSWTASGATAGPRDEQIGSLSVRVVAAAELIAADRNGSSDPYVVVQLAGGSTSVGSVLAGGLDDVRGALGELQGDMAQAGQRAKQEIRHGLEEIKQEIEEGLEGVAAAVLPKERPQVPMEKVDRPTPDGLWFTPRDGWPVYRPAPLGRTLSRPEALTTAAAAAAGTLRRSSTAAAGTTAAAAAAAAGSSARQPPPPLLMPTASEAAALYAREEAALGELRVEVLQAEGLKGLSAPEALKGLGIGAAPDPYALLMVEGFAARTSTVSDSDAPRWGYDTHRAFRFPLRRPYASLFVGMMDDDSREGVGSEQLNRLISDDGLARVIIPLGPLVPGTVYDGWYFLQYENVLRHAGSRGAIRLRLSVSYASERARLLAYVFPPADVAPLGAADTTVVPFATKRGYRSAQLAAHGRTPLYVYNEEVLKAYIVELTGLLDEALEQLGAVRDLLFWKSPLLSGLAMLLLQLLVSYPALVPAALALTPVFFLYRTLHHEEREEAGPIGAQSSVASLLCSLVLGTRSTPLQVEPAACEASEWMYASSDGHSSEEESEEQRDQRWKLGRKKRRHAHHAGWREVLGAGASKGLLDSPLLGGGSEGALHDERLRLRNEAAQREAEQATEAAEALEGRKAANAKSRGVTAPSLNPLAGVLGSVQPVLGSALRALRATKRLLTWTDRALTLWLLLGLLALSAVLALLGLLVPWAPVLRWTARITGALLLGPHMLFVGRWLDRRALAAAAKEEVFQRADAPERKAMLQAVADEVQAEVDAAEKSRAAARAKRPAWIVAKEAALRQNKYNVLLPLPKAPASKFVAAMDPKRSRATPLDAAE